eukprot:CAMPEP_0170622600 /NCGR_PEP_ID=MMETSP0224-20130122/29221_1 /TAXON_ID=285029 /ORGANISM="Togula jolla, Strain CCCM 725" /LENGTH=201 /DNA_ID=CAMNT_0010948937 /DNA_START=78 /DNA_END=683 /DNA_ORIENTATION=+
MQLASTMALMALACQALGASAADGTRMLFLDATGSGYMDQARAEASSEDLAPTVREESGGGLQRGSHTRAVACGASLELATLWLLARLMKSAQVDVSQEALQLDAAQREAGSSDLAVAGFMMRMLFIAVLGLVAGVAAAFYARYRDRYEATAWTTQKKVMPSTNCYTEKQRPLLGQQQKIVWNHRRSPSGDFVISRQNPGL